MVLLSDLDFTLPLSNPVIIFSLVLFIILFAPILFNRLRVPHLIGLIIAGIIVGPYGFNLLLRDSSIVLFGTVGLLYIMFTAGLEIDLQEFKKNRVKSLVFGLFTFVMPMVLGSLAAYYVLGYTVPTSVLMACMFASHTLLAYPIASKFGLSRIRSVTLTIGGTIITDILALLTLAAVSGMARGDISPAFWIRLGISSVVFGVIVFVGFPLIARWFFKKFEDNISQYIFVLAMVFLGSFLAEVAGLEAIIGAFLSGLALNSFIPHNSPLMNRIDFVGNAFFIPFFLISVGMLVDFRVLFNGWGALEVAGVMIVVGVVSKYIAAWLTQKTFRLPALDRQMIFGLSTARVGATLAVVLVGYNIILGETATGEPIRLLNEDVLNGTVLMILVTCTISSLVVEKASRQLALREDSQPGEGEETGEKMLVSLAYPETVVPLVDLALMLKPKKSKIPIYALHVTSDDSGSGQTPTTVRRMMDKATAHAAATENTLIPLTRFDQNISNGIIYTIKEQNITDVLIGLHQSDDPKDFLGPTTERILRQTAETIFIYKAVQPFNTLKRMLVVVTPRAELEPGFAHWFAKLATIAREAGLPLVFYAYPDTTRELRRQNQFSPSPVKAEFHHFSQWEDFLIFSRYLKTNDLFVIVSSRRGHPSFQGHLDKVAYYLHAYFSTSSFLMVYPRQLDHSVRMDDIQHADSSLLEAFSDNVGKVKAGGILKRLFRRKG